MTPPFYRIFSWKATLHCDLKDVSLVGGKIKATSHECPLNLKFLIILIDFKNRNWLELKLN